MAIRFELCRIMMIFHKNSLILSCVSHTIVSSWAIDLRLPVDLIVL